MPEISLLQKDIDYMKEQFIDLKNGQTSINDKIDKVFSEMLTTLKNEYVNKMEFSPYQEKTNNTYNALIRVVGAFISAVIAAICGVIFLK